MLEQVPGRNTGHRGAHVRAGFLEGDTHWSSLFPRAAAHVKIHLHYLRRAIAPGKPHTGEICEVSPKRETPPLQ